ncbi:MAG: 16S rRNA (cytosine(1402)-N(4))-methyltransferase RsmH [Pseudomonadota bacterium]|nr:16S rRNA (cytosine(1402)-N(4))-methyltransferase RsmH [Pseudomonadota bacterium]
MNSQSITHTPVLPIQFLEFMNINPDGTYVDATFGRGGHSQLVLSKLSQKGRVIAFDRDLDAIACAERLAEIDSRLQIIDSEFSAIPSIVPQIQKEVDGVFFDLGVSSPQLEDSSRGFSFRYDGPLDMRMNQRKGPTAEYWINSASQREIAEVLWNFGEERNSRKIAKRIVTQRRKKAIKTTTELANIIRSSSYSGFKLDAATRSFQAIRIFLNEELIELQKILDSVLGILSKGGRLLVISFHSLEDRLVKRRFRELSRPDRDVIGNVSSPVYKLLTKKPVTASEEEIRLNRRSRSARLRALESLL